MAVTLVTTKLHTPPVRPELVSRPRLLSLLDQGLHRKLTLVSAPAGFGKTTLLAEWTQRLADARPLRVRVAWISLDEGDNDPARFAVYLAAALQPGARPEPAGGDEGFEPGAAWLQEPSLGWLINQVAVQGQDVVLILDDYHLLTAAAIHAAVSYLVEHMPPNLHLVIAARADPALPLPRLRARDHLVELRQADLSFTAGEATAFLNQVMGLGLEVADVAALEARTEGWIAGLQMAALSLRGHGPQGAARAGFVRALTGSHRFILDYLVEEVLEQQPLVLQEFLLQTSILERLTGPLCDCVTGHKVSGTRYQMPDSQALLQQLEAANLFIVPLDDERRWYRYHRLFADLLRQRLQRSHPDLVPVLHCRASIWHEEQGLIPASIEHALAGRDFERAATLLEQDAEATLMRSELTTFMTWVERLPEVHVRSRPTLSFFYAWALAMSGSSLDDVEEQLQGLVSDRAGQEATGLAAGRLAALRAYLCVFKADTRRAVELCRQALEHLPEGDRFLRTIVGWILGMARLEEGGLEDGKQAMAALAKKGEDMGNPLIAVAALCQQARLLMRQGRLHQAKEILERALHVATDAQGRRLPVASKALLGLGELEREWDNLVVAEDYLLEGIELARQWTELVAFDAYFPLARLRLAQGDLEAAQGALETARELARRSQATPLDDVVAELQWAYFLIVRGDLAGATRWAEARGLMPGPVSQPELRAEEGEDLIGAHMEKYERQVLARLLIALGRPAQAMELLAPLRAKARQVGRVDLALQVCILTALASQAAGLASEAMDALAEALALAEPGDYRRAFLDEGRPMAGLLRQAAARGLAPAYVARLLAAMGEHEFAGQETVQPLVEPLSERELEVLRLLAAGRSNPQIAGELVVAVSTVHSHCKSIYGKLGVHRRWDAVQRARDLGLIEPSGGRTK